jgi:hypothetical protein
LSRNILPCIELEGLVVKEWEFMGRFIDMKKYKGQSMKKMPKEQIYRMNEQMRLCINLLPVFSCG